MTKVFNILLFCFCCHYVVNAQDYRMDMQQMNRAYLGKTNYCKQMQVKVYTNSCDNQPGTTKTNYLKKEGDYFLMVSDEMIVVCQDTMMALINTRIKNILLYPYDKNTKEDNINNVLPRVDELLHETDSVVYNGWQNKGKSYTVYSPSRVVKKSEIYLDENYFISKLVYHYNKDIYKENNIVVMETRDSYQIPGFANNQLDINQILKYSAGSFQPAGKFIEYQIINKL